MIFLSYLAGVHKTAYELLTTKISENGVLLRLKGLSKLHGWCSQQDLRSSQSNDF